jgi:hypothetical protein
VLCGGFEMTQKHVKVNMPIQCGVDAVHGILKGRKLRIDVDAVLIAFKDHDMIVEYAPSTLFAR